MMLYTNRSIASREGIAQDRDVDTNYEVVLLVNPFNQLWFVE